MPLSWPCCSRRQPWERSPTRITTLTPHARWLDESQPDKEGVQFEAIKAQLAEMPGIEYVWYDYSCMPQGDDRTLAEKLCFKWMLENVNLLYLSCSVLCILDLSYNTRFWTQFEAWCGATAALATPSNPRNALILALALALTLAIAFALILWQAVNAARHQGGAEACH